MAAVDGAKWAPLIAADLNLPLAGVNAVIELLLAGNTVPFIARYRKEKTGALDEVQIATIQERHAYVVEMEDRRKTILESIESQGKLTEELKAKILKANTKSQLEDLYLPYKPKRRTRAMIARERGLEPLAQAVLDPSLRKGSPEEMAAAFVDPEKEVADVAAALQGAKDIMAELISETPEVRASLRDTMSKEGVLASVQMDPTKQERTKFEQYYQHSEPISKAPSHRYLAMRRGEREGVLRLELQVEDSRMLGIVEDKAQIRGSGPWELLHKESARESWRRLLQPSLETDVRTEAKLNADREAVEIFAENLKNLILAAPLGTKSVIGIDPGLRTGCKCAAVDPTGAFRGTVTLFLSRGATEKAVASQTFIEFVKTHKPAAVAIGNGTGGRETEKFIRDLLKDAGLKDILVVSVNEAGASIYSASEVAREEFPELDLTIRGAISIARRLQDPLAELVKIEPKSIGVGQYQHDVYQPLLDRKLHAVVENCVNHVGVNLNTSSASLLSYVAGIGPGLAKKIVNHRSESGAFRSRQELLKVSGLGPKAFEQAAGFLRIENAEHPLDHSAVHPERYALVEKMATDIGLDLDSLIGKASNVDRIKLTEYVDESVGLETLRDIADELRKPNRDPRSEFETAKFRDDVHEIKDLKIGMDLEGVGTNVTAFGAFVDVGVHQDGLVHVSELSRDFVSNPSDVVKPGQKIKVWVLSVDEDRRRIGLSAVGPGDGQVAASVSSQPKRGNDGKRGGQRKGGHSNRGGRKKESTFSNNPFAALLK